MGDEHKLYGDYGTSLGKQNYEPDEMGTDNAHMYQSLTKTPQITIVPAQTEGNLSLKDMKSEFYTRIILVKFNGKIVEVVPQEFEEFRDFLPRGIYTAISFTWTVSGVDRMSAIQYNRNQVNTVIDIADGNLEGMIRQWFEPQVGNPNNPGKTAELMVDIENYITPLQNSEATIAGYNTLYRKQTDK